LLSEATLRLARDEIAPSLQVFTGAFSYRHACRNDILVFGAPGIAMMAVTGILRTKVRLLFNEYRRRRETP
jgi:hypothetical protein